MLLSISQYLRYRRGPQVMNCEIEPNQDVHGIAMSGQGASGYAVSLLARRDPHKMGRILKKNAASSDFAGPYEALATASYGQENERRQPGVSRAWPLAFVVGTACKRHCVERVRIESTSGVKQTLLG